MGVLPAALIIEREVGLESVFHYTCRDRNMLGMLSDLLGAAAGGLAQPADRHRRSAHSGPLPRRDRRLRHRQHRAHQRGAPAQPRARPRRQSDRRTHPVRDRRGRESVGASISSGSWSASHWKVEAGAEFAVTQPVFDPEQLESVPGAHRALPDPGHRGPLAADLAPQCGVPRQRGARASRCRRRCSSACGGRKRAGPAAEHAEGLRITQEVLDGVRGLAQGVQISVPAGRTEVALEVLKLTAPTDVL